MKWIAVTFPHLFQGSVIFIRGIRIVKNSFVKVLIVIVYLVLYNHLETCNAPYHYADSPVLHPTPCVHAWMAHFFSDVCFTCIWISPAGFTEGNLCPLPALFPFYFSSSVSLAYHSLVPHSAEGCQAHSFLLHRPVICVMPGTSGEPEHMAWNQSSCLPSVATGPQCQWKL